MKNKKIGSPKKYSISRFDVNHLVFNLILKRNRRIKCAVKNLGRTEIITKVRIGFYYFCLRWRQNFHSVTQILNVLVFFLFNLTKRRKRHNIYNPRREISKRTISVQCTRIPTDVNEHTTKYYILKRRKIKIR